MQKLMKVFFLFVITVGTASAALAQGCPTRHFYNYSNVNFGIDFQSGQGSCSVGTNPQRSACTILPGQIADLHYPDFWIYHTVQVAIMSLEGGSRHYFPRKSFFLENGCDLAHGGDTGNIVLNDPAYGDVKTCGKLNNPGGYECRY